MDDKELTPNKESILDFEDAKDMTVGQAMRKKNEIDAGVVETDSVLDKYIKQHREEIEAGKFNTVSEKTAIESETDTPSDADSGQTEIADFIKDLRAKAAHDEVSDEKENEQVEDTPPLLSDNLINESSDEAGLDVSETKDVSDVLPNIEHIPMKSTLPSQFLEDEVTSEEIKALPVYKRKRGIYWTVSVLLVAAIATTAYVMVNRGQAPARNTTTSSQTSSSTSSSSENSSLKAFNDLYDAFFTDANKLYVKNSQFGKLDELKSALEQLNGSSEYTVAKAKYDSLVKQITAVQELNAKFETAVITDGVVNPNAKAKSEAQFSDVTTGNEELDKVLKEAVRIGNQQKSQTSTNAAVNNAPAGNTSQAAEAVPEQAPSTPTPAPVAPTQATLNLQRHLSRVPYNQALIDDVNNPSWQFNPGVLEKILATSRERGYFAGDQYILEKVNIINGNGYYNLFRADGTYLFSINCKTGYFVGNGAGYTEDLDY